MYVGQPGKQKATKDVAWCCLPFGLKAGNNLSVFMQDEAKNRVRRSYCCCASS